MTLNFSSSHYLNMHHSSAELPSWDAFSTGVPAALWEPPSAISLGQRIAHLQGLSTGILAPSSFHLFWDWFGSLNPAKHVVFTDRHLYRVGAWGAERATGKGVSHHFYRHLCPGSLSNNLKKFVKHKYIPVVVTDGWCPFCGKPAPLSDYLNILYPYKGLLIVDDTQALGILGKAPSAAHPLGSRGGGILPFLGLEGQDNMLIIASLAKGFGVPLAVISGSVPLVNAYKNNSEMRLHASPPSAAAIAAGKNALMINSRKGLVLRKNLVKNILFFKTLLAENRLYSFGKFFPVQTLGGFSTRQMRNLHTELLKRKIKSVPVITHNHQPRLCFIIRADHQEHELHHLVKTLVNCLKILQIENQTIKHLQYYAKPVSSSTSAPCLPLPLYQL